MGKQKMANLTPSFFSDLHWFCTFLRQFNGVVYYYPRSIQAELQLDACLTGMGVFLKINAMNIFQENTMLLQTSYPGISLTLILGNR